GISYGPDLSASKVRLLQEKARVYSYNCFVFQSTTIDNFVSEVSLAWGDHSGSYMHVVSSYMDEEISPFISSDWLFTVLRSSGKVSDVEYSPGTENPGKIFINKLEELPLTICSLNKKVRKIMYTHLHLASLNCLNKDLLGNCIITSP
uniref:Inositol 1,3,4-trisphosphate 5/6-kinase 4-like n=1 Tax=Nicotiana tabacum TaxID=4097 RepID=A0A1S3XEV6_TOBAC